LKIDYIDRDLVLLTCYFGGSYVGCLSYFYLGLQTHCWSFDRAICHPVCSYWRKIWQFGICKATDTCGC